MTYNELTNLNLSNNTLIEITTNNYTYDLKYILVKAWFKGFRHIDDYDFEIKKET